jgi:hypothetical protein
LPTKEAQFNHGTTIDESAEMTQSLQIVGTRLTRLGHTAIAEKAVSSGSRSALSIVVGVDATIVVWTEQSIVSKAVEAIAANALLLDRLISVLGEGMQPDCIPSRFRCTEAIGISDIQAITRQVETKSRNAGPESLAPASAKGVGSCESIKYER